MTNTEQYDVLIIGSGEAGKYLAWHFAALGKRTAVVERKYIGGSCPNIACLPSKNIIQSAKVASYFQRSEEFGISKDHWKLEMAGVRDRKRRMVEHLVQVHLGRYKNTGAELVLGQATFVAPKTVSVTLAEGGTRVLGGEHVILSTGSRATMDSIPGLPEVQPLTHVEALELDRLPEHLLVLGGGYVGLEFAQAFRRFGSRVTVIEQNSRLAHREDEDVAAALQQLFQAEGIDICVNARITRADGRSGSSVRLQGTTDGAGLTLEGTHILLATGRTPNTDGIGLDLAGVKLDERGYIQVNEKLETTAPGVWAVGDCAGSPHFTHVAFDDFRVVRENLAGRHRVTTGRQVPFCLFTDPELARVGLSETEARRRNIPYRLAKIPTSLVLRTQTLSETTGFLKALIEKETDRILGFAAFGTGVGDLLAPVQLAMAASLPYTALRDSIFTHPTMSEGLVVLFAAGPH